MAQDEAQRKADQEREAFDTAKNNGDCVGIVRLLAEVTAADVHRHGCRRVWEMIQPTRETSLEDANKEHEKDLVTAGSNPRPSHRRHGALFPGRAPDRNPVAAHPKHPVHRVSPCFMLSESILASPQVQT